MSGACVDAHAVGMSRGYHVEYIGTAHASVGRRLVADDSWQSGRSLVFLFLFSFSFALFSSCPYFPLSFSHALSQAIHHVTVLNHGTHITTSILQDVIALLRLGTDPSPKKGVLGESSPQKPQGTKACPRDTHIQIPEPEVSLPR